ncbi:MAG: glycosyl transferase [Chloroflexales bacterium]|nr:glycosyl transferase [Chloroflexales bacterium]
MTNVAARGSLLRDRWSLAFILFLALAIRLALWAQPLHLPANDEVEYVTVARDLLAGRGWQFYDSYHWLRAPFYTLFLAGSLWLFGGNLHLAALPNIVLSVATVYLIYRLTQELIPRSSLQSAPNGASSQTQQRWGRAFISSPPLVAALLAAVLLTNGTFASLYMSETLFSFLFTAGLLLLLRWRHRALTPAGIRPRSQYATLASAGVCFGLATLTRSLPLFFLPVVLLWMLGIGWRPKRQVQSLVQYIRARLTYAAVFALFVLLTIAPWTLRNCQAYGQCILIETGLSYNLWTFSEPREDQQTIFRTLEQIPNPADRADEATRRGLERLREDPAIMARKLWPNWHYIWRVKPIEDRFLLQNYYADPHPLLFFTALIFDDALYLAILVASVFGLRRALTAAALPRAAALLLALWVLYVLATTMLTHGEARYRHFFFPVLISFAALGLIRRQITDHEQQPRTKPLLAYHLLPLAACLLLLSTFVVYYPWDWALGGAARSWQRMVGDRALARGDLSGAALAYERALAAQATPDTWLALGNVRYRQGNLVQAEVAYRAAWSLELPYVAASSTLGDFLHTVGRDDEARVVFAGRYIIEQEVIEWSWKHLNPPPVQRIEVGDGLDFGYVSGVYAAEQQQGTWARWTNGAARLRLPPEQGGGGDLTLVQVRLAAPHHQTTGVTARICSGDYCQLVTLDPTWRVFSLLMPSAALHSGIVEVRSPTFEAPDGRRLGVLLDWAKVRG